MIAGASPLGEAPLLFSEMIRLMVGSKTMVEAWLISN